jgi:hypothetical protein
LSKATQQMLEQFRLIRDQAIRRSEAHFRHLTETAGGTSPYLWPTATLIRRKAATLQMADRALDALVAEEEARGEKAVERLLAEVRPALLRREQTAPPAEEGARPSMARLLDTQVIQWDAITQPNPAHLYAPFATPGPDPVDAATLHLRAAVRGQNPLAHKERTWAWTEAYLSWYTFPESGSESFALPLTLDLHGHYLCRPGWMPPDGPGAATCSLTVSTNVYRFTRPGAPPHEDGWLTTPVLPQPADALGYWGRIDETRAFTRVTQVGRHELLVLLARVELLARAEGIGSYAELDLATPTFGYIKAAV